MFRKYDDTELRKLIKKQAKRIDELEAKMEEYHNEQQHDCSSVRKDIPDVRAEGEKWFADKRVQMIVYGFVGIILTAAGASFVGGIPWLG